MKIVTYNIQFQKKPVNPPFLNFPYADMRNYRRTMVLKAFVPPNVRSAVTLGEKESPQADRLLDALDAMFAF